MRFFRSRTLIQISFWAGAILIGLVSVVFDRIIAFCQQSYFHFFYKFPILVTLGSPIFLLLAVAIVVFLAPTASGSGIPQAMKAMWVSLGSHQSALKSGLVSIRTAFIKMISTILGILGGASIGREGPTVQIAASLFSWIGGRVKKVFPYADFHSFIVAGAAAGVSAAFNTPLAGITFALEEMAEGTFSQIKQTVMISVVIGGICSQAILGNYLYFGHPKLQSPEVFIFVPALLIGLLGGGLGGLFAKGFLFLREKTLSMHWFQKAFLCVCVISFFNYFTQGKTAGSGYEITRHFMNSSHETLPILFPLEKLVTLTMSFLSGMGGGIFSPSLSVGAGMGSSIAQIFAFSQIKTCALFGMVAFFTGAIQVPLTAVVIVMEMSDIHEMILPLMICAFIAQGTSRLIQPISLYRYLAQHETYKRMTSS